MGKIDKSEESTEAKTSITVDKTKYNKSRAASGSSSLNNGDSVAIAMNGMELEEAQQLADKFIGKNDFRDRYSALNAGMQRMNIGNRIRGHIKKAVVKNKDGEVKTSGEDVFAKVSKPFVAIVVKRLAAEVKEKQAKEKQAAAEKQAKEAEKQAKKDARAKAKGEKEDKAA